MLSIQTLRGVKNFLVEPIFFLDPKAEAQKQILESLFRKAATEATVPPERHFFWTATAGGVWTGAVIGTCLGGLPGAAVGSTVGGVAGMLGYLASAYLDLPDWVSEDELPDISPAIVSSKPNDAPQHSVGG